MIEGKATIELTDVNTGQKETVFEKNMVTNAIPYFFSDDVMNSFSLNNQKIFDSGLCPIYAKLMGGLLLFEEPLEENADNLYAPRSNRCVGCANQEVNTSDNPMRGSLNTTESKKLSDGYQFVWDFATHQGNGTISTLALSHPNAGVAYWGESFSSGYNESTVWAFFSQRSDINATGIQAAFTCVMEMNVEQKYLAMIYPDFISKELVVEKRYLPIRERSIFEEVSSTEFSFPLLATHRITPTLYPVTVSPYKMNFFCWGDYWYGFGIKSSSRDQSVIARLKIKKADFSVTENVENPNDCKEIPLQEGVTTYPNVIPTAQINDWIALGSSPYAIIDDVLVSSPRPFYSSSSYIYFTYSRVKSFQYHHLVFSLGCMDTGSQYPRQLAASWMLPYLATINNLSTPVEKTPDKTMKITYTLRMVDEGAGV